MIEQAERAGFIVLGGDVWLTTDDRYRPALANWSFEPSGSPGADVAPSAARAREFVSSYPSDEAVGPVLFEIGFRLARPA